MSQAFLNGFRASSNLGMGNVRTPQMRSTDQGAGFSGNPGMAYNMPRMQPPVQAPSKPMQVRMPIIAPPGQPGLQVQQMPVAPVQRAQYARPALASINNQGRRVFAL